MKDIIQESIMEIPNKYAFNFLAKYSIFLLINPEDDILITFLSYKDYNINNTKPIIEDKNNIFIDTIYSDLEYNAFKNKIEQVKFNVFCFIFFFRFK